MPGTWPSRLCYTNLERPNVRKEVLMLMMASRPAATWAKVSGMLSGEPWCVTRSNHPWHRARRGWTPGNSGGGPCTACLALLGPWPSLACPGRCNRFHAGRVLVIASVVHTQYLESGEEVRGCNRIRILPQHSKLLILRTMFALDGIHQWKSEHEGKVPLLPGSFPTASPGMR
jgi:hypothetical protein